MEILRKGSDVYDRIRILYFFHIWLHFTKKKENGNGNGPKTERCNARLSTSSDSIKVAIGPIFTRRRRISHKTPRNYYWLTSSHFSYTVLAYDALIRQCHHFWYEPLKVIKMSSALTRPDNLLNISLIVSPHRPSYASWWSADGVFW
jgi:hypothetical protein